MGDSPRTTAAIRKLLGKADYAGTAGSVSSVVVDIIAAVLRNHPQNDKTQQPAP